MKSFIIAAQFLTRIPLKVNMEVSNEEFGSSQKAFIFVGFLLGGIISGAYYFLNFNLPPFVLGGVLLLLEIGISGGLLLDGFMDTCDGIFSARPRERALEIMKDSRVGAHSVTSVTLLFIIKYSIYSSLQYLNNPYIITLLAPAVGLWFLLFIIVFFPYARKEGIGKFFKDRTKISYFNLSSAILFAASWLVAGNFYPIVGILITFFAGLSVASKINNFLLGHTGDTYGAMAQTAQGIFMLVMIFLLY
jgi:adenosylcobinamide-GDP ribazoletransferase